MPQENRLHLTSPKEGFIGIDQISPGQALSLGHFFKTDNIIPNNSGQLIRRPGATLVAAQTTGTITALALHVFHRRTANDELLMVASRTALSDAIYRFDNVSAFTLIDALPATNAIYHLVQFKDKIFILDGINAPRVYNGTTVTTLVGTNIPTLGQYGLVYQDRLMVGVPNTDLVHFSDILDETVFQAGNTINADVQYGDKITGLTIVASSTGDRAAQQAFAILKERNILLLQGALPGATLSQRSSLIGTQSFRTAIPTPYGTFVLGTAYFGQDNPAIQKKIVSIFYLSTFANEPLEVGYNIRPSLSDLTDAQLSRATAVLHDQTYKISVPAGASSINNSEWHLDLRPEQFKDKRRWFGPHSGNEVSHMVVYRNALFAARENATTLWRIDENTSYQYMISVPTNREWSVITPTLSSPDSRLLLWEALGVDINTVLNEIITVDFLDESGSLSASQTFPVNNARAKLVFRPHRQARTMQATIRGGLNTTSMVTISSLHYRIKPIIRQGGMA